MTEWIDSPWATKDRPCDPIWWEVRGTKVVAAFCTIGECVAEAAPIIRKLLRLGNDGGRRDEEARRGNQVHGAWMKSAFPKIERAFGTITRMEAPRSRPKTRVVHHKKEPFDVYIGRPSAWGNPFSHKPGTLACFQVATRDEAIVRYEEHLRANLKLLAALSDLEGKVLGCWCKPQSCHGDVIVKLLEEMWIP